MKKILKAPIVFALAVLARAVVRKYRPKIVMVTGSVGKTSTKDALAAVLSTRFYLSASKKSHNGEFGVPLTIFGSKSLGNPFNPFAWLRVFKEAFALLILPSHYPNLLVLEVGADRPGDLAKVLKIVTPDAVVVTRLPEVPVHVEAYASPEAVRAEEFSPARALPAAAPLIVAADDVYALDLAKQCPARLVTYGFETDADVRLHNPDFLFADERVIGMRALVESAGMQGEIFVHGSVGKTQLLPAAAALALATALGVELSAAIEALASYVPPPGRGRLLAGKNGSLIIDDSYNSSPAAVTEALATLKVFPNAKRKIAVLGDMLELGRHSVEQHEKMGALAAASADIIISVGIRARRITESARVAGTPATHLLSFDDSRNAALALKKLLEPGDVILVKGSQSVRTERIVASLLANPSDISKLVRQEREWQRR